jgi:hypothetical protein
VEIFLKLLNTDVTIDECLACLSDNLRYRLSLLDISLDAFARGANVGISTLIGVLRNKQHTVKLDFVINCAKFLNCNTEDLLFEKDRFQYIPVIHKNELTSFLADRNSISAKHIKVSYIHKNSFAVYDLITTNDGIHIHAMMCIYPIQILKNNNLFLIKYNQEYRLINVIQVSDQQDIIGSSSGVRLELSAAQFELIGMVTKIIYNDTFI